MQTWQVGLIVFAVVGITVLFIAFRRDRSTARRISEMLKNPPERDIPKFDPATPRPEYLTELESRQDPPGASSTELSDEDRRALRDLLKSSKATRIEGGYPLREFATDQQTGWAVIDEPIVLVATDEVTSMRELLQVIAAAGRSAEPAEGSLVITAPGFSDEVVDTLRVNKQQRKLRVCPVLTLDVPASIADVLGAQPLSAADLRSGYVPDGALGRPSRWVSDEAHSWIITSQAAAD